MDYKETEKIHTLRERSGNDYSILAFLWIALFKLFTGKNFEVVYFNTFYATNASLTVIPTILLLCMFENLVFSLLIDWTVYNSHNGCGW